MLPKSTRGRIRRIPPKYRGITRSPRPGQGIARIEIPNENSYFKLQLLCKIKNVLCYCKPGLNKGEFGRFLPRKLLESTIKWFHIVNGHPDEKGMELTLGSRSYHPELRCYELKLDMNFVNDTKHQEKGIDCNFREISHNRHSKK